MKKINKSKIVKKGTNYVMLGAVLSTTALSLMHAPSVMAAEVNPNVSQILSETAEEASAVIYTDATGEHTLSVSEGNVVKLSATATTLDMTIDGTNYSLKGIKELTFKGITVNALIPFYLDGVTKVTLDTVNFSKGIDFSDMKNIETLVVKDSTFGSTDYSLAIHSAPELTTLAVDNSTFNADFRIYDNHTLETAYVSNSTFKKDVSQYSNKKGYFTDFINNRFERSGTQRVIHSGGMSKDDVFYINPNETTIGNSPFDNTKDGFVGYTKDGNKEKIEVPAGVTITDIKDSQNTISISLSNGQTYKIENSTELNFKNVDITTTVAFTQKSLKLNKITFIGSRTKFIDIAHSETITDVQVIDTEISQSSGYLSIYDNSAIKNLEIQNAVVTGTSGYISVYNNKAMSKFVVNDVYTRGYLSAYNLGETVLQISNSLFEDYISTNQVIEGEGSRAIIGDAPVIEGAVDQVIEKFEDFDPLKGITANDTEDGDLTAVISVEGILNVEEIGDYPLVYTVTDSDGNTTTVSITITVG